MDNVNAYFAEKYAFDFDEEHRKFISQILPPRDKDASFRNQEIDLYNFQEILDYDGITPESSSYYYLASLSNVLFGWFAGGPVGAITDSWANNYCHFAMQCDGGWRQSCSSGECAPYDCHA